MISAVGWDLSVLLAFIQLLLFVNLAVVEAPPVIFIFHMPDLCFWEDLPVFAALPSAAAFFVTLVVAEALLAILIFHNDLRCWEDPCIPLAFLQPLSFCEPCGSLSFLLQLSAPGAVASGFQHLISISGSRDPPCARGSTCHFQNTMKLSAAISSCPQLC